MSGEQQDGIWPLPMFRFSVDIGDLATGLLFQEVSDLDTEARLVEYRASDSKSFSVVKMPGLAKTGTVTLKKGVFVKDNRFWSWFDQIKMNLVKRQTVTIRLLDETGKPTMTWKLANAWPTKITGTDLKSDGNEVAVETLEIAHEGIVIES